MFGCAFRENLGTFVGIEGYARREVKSWCGCWILLALPSHAIL